MTATTTASQVYALNVSCFTVLIQADPNNNTDLFVGNATVQPIHLLPGQIMTVDTNNLQAFYAITTSGTALVNWFTLGSP
jgi:hypothetical protein